MDITGISSQITAIGKNALQQGIKQKTAEGQSFGDLLAGQLEQIENTQAQADQLTQDLVVGNTEDLHSVLIAAEEARITLETAVQVRNKAVDAYKEIMNMQI